MNGQVVKGKHIWVEQIIHSRRLTNSAICHAGKSSFNGMSLHHIGDVQNPYEQAISIIGQTLSAFDEDNLIPCYGFGDGKSYFFVIVLIYHGNENTDSSVIFGKCSIYT
jgi:hypothetical protein